MYKIALNSRNLSGMKRHVQTKSIIAQASDERQGYLESTFSITMSFVTLTNHSGSLSLSSENGNNMIYPAVPDIS